MVAVQLDLFREMTSDDILKAEIDELKERQENMRRGLFARHNDMVKLVFSLQNEVEGLQGKIKEMRKGVA
jgi:hypothetical protein